MVKPYKVDDDNIYAVVSVSADAACPGDATIKVKLVMGSEGVKRVASTFYGELVKSFGDYISYTQFNAGAGRGGISDCENGIGIIRCVKVNIEMEEGDKK